MSLIGWLAATSGKRRRVDAFSPNGDQSSNRSNVEPRVENDNDNDDNSDDSVIEDMKQEEKDEILNETVALNYLNLNQMRRLHLLQVFANRDLFVYFLFFLDRKDTNQLMFLICLYLLQQKY